ncbi:MAG: phage tail assembly protein [Candidatus Binataceae bacterium]
MADEYPRTITLPSGKAATIRKPQGRDMRLAARQANKDDGGLSQMYALLARVTTIGERQLTLEDIDELDLADVNALSEALSADFLPPSRFSSPSSSNEESE